MLGRKRNWLIRVGSQYLGHWRSGKDVLLGKGKEASLGTEPSVWEGWKGGELSTKQD